MANGEIKDTVLVIMSFKQWCSIDKSKLPDSILIIGDRPRLIGAGHCQKKFHFIQFMTFYLFVHLCTLCFLFY